LCDVIIIGILPKETVQFGGRAEPKKVEPDRTIGCCDCVGSTALVVLESTC
jgi:hypothetical protein